MYMGITPELAEHTCTGHAYTHARILDTHVYNNISIATLQN